MTNIQPKPYITTTWGGAGFFAVHLWWNPDGFYEPWNSGIGRYADEAEAEAEGREWAECEGLEFRPAPPRQLDAHVTAFKMYQLRAQLAARRHG